jgi:hypothetical protein
MVLPGFRPSISSPRQTRRGQGRRLIEKRIEELRSHLAYAADSSTVPRSFVKRKVRTLGKPGWTRALFALRFGLIVQRRKQCVRGKSTTHATPLR